jgi:endoglucanase
MIDLLTGVPRKNTRNFPWRRCGLALLALLAACGSDGATDQPACQTTASADCACVAGETVCELPSITVSRDASVVTASGSDTGRSVPAEGPTPVEPWDASRPTSEEQGEDPSGQGMGQGAVGFVGEHGALRVSKNRVVDQHGKVIQLRGMSWFWSQWTDFYVAKNVDVMVDDWKATVVRAALGVENEDGYLLQPEANLAKVRTLVDRAIARGVYVIIDWHDHHAQDHKAQAIDFFDKMAKAYGKQPHVIFEIYNEPMNVSWPVVKSYAEQVIRTIRAAGSDNLIIVGTPTWSQDVDVAANDRIQSDPNVAYTLHFYANTHRQFLRDKAKAALDRGIALVVTEWGTCSADGNGAVDEGETRAWLSFLRTNGISWANWALNNKAEACSAVRPAAASVGPWRDEQLTPSGLLVKRAIP